MLVTYVAAAPPSAAGEPIRRTAAAIDASITSTISARVKAQRAPRVEPRQVDASNPIVLLQQQPGDQVARDNEEASSPDETSRQESLVRVVSEDEDDGKRTQAVEAVKSLAFHDQGVGDP